MSRAPGKSTYMPRTSSRISQADSSRPSNSSSRNAPPSSRTRAPPPGRPATTIRVSTDGSRVSVSNRPTPASSVRGPGTSAPRSSSTAPAKTSAKPSTGRALPTAKVTISTSKGTVPPGKGKKPAAKKDGQESVLKKFDRKVNEELKRRRDPKNVLVTATTSDVNLLEAVDHLDRAEAAHSFPGAVRAAEEAAATALSPELAEEAAVAGARDFETELTDMFDENIPGLKPIQVIGYVGITRPTKAIR